MEGITIPCPTDAGEVTVKVTGEPVLHGTQWMIQHDGDTRRFTVPTAADHPPSLNNPMKVLAVGRRGQRGLPRANARPCG
jgi:hypothetical protein